MPTSRRSLLLATLVLLLAAFLRLYDLGDTPPGVGHDEATSILDEINFVQYGAFPSFVHPQEPEVVFKLPQAVLLATVGPYPFTARLASALWGMLAVALTFQAGRSLLREHPQRTIMALLAAGALAFNLNHLTISHAMYRTVTLSAVLPAALWLLTVAWRTRRFRLYAWAGIVWGASVLTYTSGLFALPALIGMLVVQAIFHFRSVRSRLPYLGVLLVAMLLMLVIPLVQEISAPGPLYARSAEIDDGNPARSPLETLAELPKLYLKSIEGIYRAGDENPKANTASQPLLNPIMIGLLLIGIAAAPFIRRGEINLSPLPSPHTERGGTGTKYLTSNQNPNNEALGGEALVVLLAVMVLPSALGDLPAHGLRSVGLYAPITLLIGMGGAALVSLLGRSGGSVGQAVMRIALIAAVLISGGLTFNTYHGYYADPASYDRTQSVTIPWYFATERAELGTRLRAVTVPTYLPLDEFSFEVTRLALSGRYPRAESFTALAAAGESLALPDDGQIVMSLALAGGPAPTSYVLLLPSDPPGGVGRAILLPALDTDSAAAVFEMALAGEQWSTAREGTLGYRADLSGATNPFRDLHAPAISVLATFGEGLELVGWDAPAILTPGQPAVVTLYWRASKPLHSDFYAYVHLLDRNGTGLSAGGDSPIARWSRSPRTWRIGEVIPETRLVMAPAEMQPGAYGLLVGVYEPFSEPLAVTGPGGEDLGVSYQLWPLKVAAAPTELPDDLIGVQAILGEQIALEGYTLLHEGEPITWEALAPGEPFTLTLYWRALADLSTTYHIFVHVEGADGAILTASDGPPQDGAYPSTIWNTGEIVATTHTLTIPAEGEIAAIRLGIYGWPDLARLAVIQDGQHPEDDRVTLWP